MTYSQAVYKSRTLCAIFQLFIRLLFKCGSFFDGDYSTFTYYVSLKIEKLLKIFFGGQIGSSQEAEAGECDFDSFCFAHSRRNFFAWTWRHFGTILLPPFGRASERGTREMSIACHPRAWQKAPSFWHAVWQCIEGRQAAGNYSWMAKGSSRQRFIRPVVRPFQMLKWTKPSSDIFYFHAHNFCYTPHVLKPNTFSESRCIAHCLLKTVSLQNSIMWKKLEKVWGPGISEWIIISNVLSLQTSKSSLA